eukprot:GCRY01005997.1.p1 GENE.GCRY01005997.1~~GCRY01005997.1.p1  ORF type:complete len:407 (+),score=128.32 GCRY01005997.1:1652-2872(+)
MICSNVKALCRSSGVQCPAGVDVLSLRARAFPLKTPRGKTDRGVGPLLCTDIRYLRLVLAAAFNSHFLQSNVEHSPQACEMVKEANYTAHKSFVIRGLRDDGLWTSDRLQTTLSTIGFPTKRVYIPAEHKPRPLTEEGDPAPHLPADLVAVVELEIPDSDALNQYTHNLKHEFSVSIEDEPCILSAPSAPSRVIDPDCPIVDAPTALRAVYQLCAGPSFFLPHDDAQDQISMVGFLLPPVRLAYTHIDPVAPAHPSTLSPLYMLANWNDYSGPGASVLGVGAMSSLSFDTRAVYVARPEDHKALREYNDRGGADYFRVEGLTLLPSTGLFGELALLCFSPSDMRVRLFLTPANTITRAQVRQSLFCLVFFFYFFFFLFVLYFFGVGVGMCGCGCVWELFFANVVDV